MRQMSKTIRNIVFEANEAMQTGTMKENDSLFYFINNLLHKHNMYWGFNTYCWAELPNGDKWLKLIGGDESHRDEKGQCYEKDTDIRQFYVV